MKLLRRGTCQRNLLREYTMSPSAQFLPSERGLSPHGQLLHEAAASSRHSIRALLHVIDKDSSTRSISQTLDSCTFTGSQHPAISKQRGSPATSLTGTTRYSITRLRSFKPITFSDDADMIPYGMRRINGKDHATKTILRLTDTSGRMLVQAPALLKSEMSSDS